MCVELSARNSGSGPEAERDAAMSVVRMLRNMTAAVRFGGVSINFHGIFPISPFFYCNITGIAVEFYQ